MREIKTDWLLEAMVNSKMQRVGLEIKISSELSSSENVKNLGDDYIKAFFLRSIRENRLNIHIINNQEKLNKLKENLLIYFNFDPTDKNFKNHLTHIEINSISFFK